MLKHQLRGIMIPTSIVVCIGRRAFGVGNIGLLSYSNKTMDWLLDE